MASGISVMWLLSAGLLIVAGVQLWRRKFVQGITLGISVIGLGVVDYGVHELAIFDLQSNLDALEVYPWLLYFHMGYLLSFIGTLGFFLFLAVRSKVEAQVNKLGAWVSIGSFALALTITASPVPAFSHVVVALRQDGFSYIPVSDDAEYQAVSFDQAIYFDEPNLWGEISLPLLIGSGAIDGVITYRGKPADVSVRAFVGERWRTTTVRTGPDGAFSLMSPTGSIEINRLDFDYWFNKPRDEMARLVVLREPKLTFAGSFFDSADYEERITLDEAFPGPIILEIVDFIEMAWPEPGVTEQVGGRHSQKISWSSVEDAAYYELTVSLYGPNRKSARNHYRVSLGSTSLPLSQLPLVPTETKTEYYVMVRAFSQDGRFLSTSKSGFVDTSFWIPGHAIEPNVSTCKQN